MTRWASTEILRPISNTERRNRLLMGMIGAHEDADDCEEGDDYEPHMQFETRKELFI